MTGITFHPADRSTRKFSDMNEPTGFVNRADSTLTWSDSTPDRTLTIAPASTTFDYYIAGKRYNKSASETVQIGVNEGLHSIYYDGSILAVQANPTDAQTETIILTKAWVADIYWDATNSIGELLDERHGITMDGNTHRELHFTAGTTYFDGLALGDITADQNGNTDSHAQFSVATGQIFDEDIKHITNAIGSTTGLEVWYRDASLDWRKDTQAGFSVLNAAAGRVYYDNAGTLTEVTDNKWVLYHVFAWNAADLNPIAIMGQAEYSTKKAARLGSTTEINALLLGSLPSHEMKAIATVIFQTKDTYSNSVKARIVTTDEGDDYVDWRTAMISPSAAAQDHGSLSGLTDDDHAGHPWLIGRSGGQTLIGGVDANDDLTLEGTSHATRTTSYVNLQPNGGNVGIGTSSPDSAFHIKADFPAGQVGNNYAGQIIIQNPADSVFSNAVITGYESDGSGNPDQQLWYLGSASVGNSDITFLNRRNSKLTLGTSGTSRITILGSGNVGFNVIDPDTQVEILNAGNQLKLSFDGTDNVVFAVDTDGVLTITPSGAAVNFASNITLTGTVDGIDIATDVAANTTHRGSDGSDHSFIDQDVTSGSSPTFTGANFTAIDADDVNIADGGSIITATQVEAALQENRTAIDLNTAHVGDNTQAHSDYFLNTGADIAGSGSGFAWTFNASAGTDSVITFGDGTINVSTGALQVGGNAVLDTTSTVSALTTVGTIGTGVWQGTAVTDGYIASAATWNAKIANVVEDTTPQLGGDLDMNDKNVALKFEPGSDVTASGLIVTMTVDTNAEGVGAPLFLAADGHLDTADADSSTTSPCVALALETGTGSKKVLVHGILRVDAWNWTMGPGKASLIYVHTTVGTLNQTQPSGTDDVVQPVGWAISDDCIYFCPSLIYFTHT